MPHNCTEPSSTSHRLAAWKYPMIFSRSLPPHEPTAMSRFFPPIRHKLQAIAQRAAATLAALDESERFNLTGPQLTRALHDLEEGGARVFLACDHLIGATDPGRACCS